MELAAKAAIGLIDALFWVSYLGLVLGLAVFPVYAIGFIVRLIRRRFDQLHHPTMVLLSLAFVLSGLAVLNNFMSFSRRAKQSEAKTNLGAIFTCQVSYYGEYKEYARGKDCFELIGWEPEGDTIYAYFCDQDVLMPTKARYQDRAVPSLEELVLLGAPRPEVSKDDFLVMAAGNIDRDDYLDVWTIDSRRNWKNVINDVANSGGGKETPAAMIGRRLTVLPSTPYQVLLGILTPILVWRMVRDEKKARKK